MPQPNINKKEVTLRSLIICIGQSYRGIDLSMLDQNNPLYSCILCNKSMCPSYMLPNKSCYNRTSFPKGERGWVKAYTDFGYELM